MFRSSLSNFRGRVSDRVRSNLMRRPISRGIVSSLPFPASGWMQLFRCHFLSLSLPLYLSLSWGSLDSEIRSLAALLRGNFRANTYGAESFPCVQHAIAASLSSPISIARSDLIKRKEKCNPEFTETERKSILPVRLLCIYISSTQTNRIFFFFSNKHCCGHRCGNTRIDETFSKLINSKDKILKMFNIKNSSKQI